MRRWFRDEPPFRSDPAGGGIAGAPRGRGALLSGKLVYGQSKYSEDVTIRDLTETGAKVRLRTDVVVHDPVWLIHSVAGIAYRSAVAWRKPPELGLRFEESLDLSKPISGDLHHLRRLWIDSNGG